MGSTPPADSFLEYDIDSFVLFLNMRYPGLLLTAVLQLVLAWTIAAADDVVTVFETTIVTDTTDCTCTETVSRLTETRSVLITSTMKSSVSSTFPSTLPFATTGQIGAGKDHNFFT
jgi:hypothetical protein